DTYNLVAFLEKPTESEGFEEIVDFLNANPIKYALTFNLTIYLDKKKVIITESTIRRDLQLEDANGVDDEDVGVEADMNNLDAFMPVSPIPTTRIHKYHPVEQIIGDLHLAPQTRRMTKNLEEHGLFSLV
ncbi:hypothetical protein Tco_1197971, partial [Tanacetum coccineum]